MKTKKISIILISFLLVCSLLNFSNAADKTIVDISTQNEIEPGKILIVTLPVTGDGDGVNGLQGTLKYDSNVLELVDKSTISGWTITGYNPSTGIFLAEVSNVADQSTFITNKKDLITFKFKVKDNATVGETKIDVTNMVASGANSLQNTSVSKTVNIVGATNSNSNSNSNTENSSNNNTNNNSSSNNNSSNNSNNSSNSGSTNNSSNKANADKSTIATKAIPYAGKEDLLVKLMIVLGVLSIFFYIKFNKYKDVI